MNILEKLENLKEKFEHMNHLIEEKNNKIQEVNLEINEILDEQKRMQGAYRTLIELGIEDGLIDSEGNVLSVDEENDKPEEEK